MWRHIGFIALAALMGLLVTEALRGQDKVERRDKKAGSVTVAGKILSENAAGIKVKAQGFGKEEMIPSNDVLRVTYSDLPAKASLEIGKMAPAEAAHDYPALLKGYEEIQQFPEVQRSAGPDARRYIDYKVATLRAQVAESEEDLKAAEKGLVAFVAAHPNSWEYPHAARQLGRLQADTGNYAAATKTFEELRKAENVPAEVRSDATAALIDLAFQSEDYDAGKKRVAAVLQDPMAPAGLKARADMYQLGLEGAKGDLAASVKKIEDAIAKATDPSLKALGYNVLGDVYAAQGKARDAMWSYLWVDVVYNQDRGEHLKAMNRLIKIFAGAGDKEKEQLYKEKVAQSR